MNPRESLVSLKWQDFHTNLPLSFQDARLSKEFCDVTLVSDDDTVLEAHRVILVAGSLFFEKILRGSKIGNHPHPMLYLKGFFKDELTAALDFLYCGEAQVKQESLNSFLTTAQQLGIKGLIEEPNIYKPEDQTYVENSAPIEPSATPNEFDNESKPGYKDQKCANTFDSIEVNQQHPVDKAVNSKTSVDILQKKWLRQESNIRSNWILQNVSTFPKLPMPLKKLMSVTNKIRVYSILVMNWFLKPLGLKPGRKSFAGWEFLVSPKDFTYIKHLPRELSDGDFRMADIIDWSRLERKRGFYQGTIEDLKSASGNH